jgi:predicted molibdopterin-dependent oxidoreductase YjgC
LEQNAFLPPAGESKPDWEIMCLVAKALGLSGFDYKETVLNKIYKIIKSSNYKY